jgi:hypothetical protein
MGGIIGQPLIEEVLPGKLTKLSHFLRTHDLGFFVDSVDGGLELFSFGTRGDQLFREDKPALLTAARLGICLQHLQEGGWLREQCGDAEGVLDQAAGERSSFSDHTPLREQDDPLKRPTRPEQHPHRDRTSRGDRSSHQGCVSILGKLEPIGIFCAHAGDAVRYASTKKTLFLEPFGKIHGCVRSNF